METDLETRITAILSVHHRGRESAISAGDLAADAGCSERKVRAIIAHLVEEHGLMIGSHPSKGFFIIRDRADLDLAERQLKSRAMAILKRWSRLTKKSIPVLAKQLEMFEGEL